MTNSTIWAPGSREALRTSCMKELSQNTTLKKQTENEKTSISEQIKRIICINECSGRGNCINGEREREREREREIEIVDFVFCNKYEN